MHRRWKADAGDWRNLEARRCDRGQSAARRQFGFFGRENITSISEAAIFLGVEVLKDIVLTAEIINNEKWSPDQVAQLRDIFFSFVHGQSLLAYCS